jgi:hypothetical protein
MKCCHRKARQRIRSQIHGAMHVDCAACCSAVEQGCSLTRFICFNLSLKELSMNHLAIDAKNDANQGSTSDNSVLSSAMQSSCII